MKILMTSLLVFIVSACITGNSKIAQGLTINHSSIEVELDTVSGFEDLISRQLGYGSKYQKLIDSLSLKSADTVGFFIRPCFKHRGVFFKIANSKCEEYYFNFSRPYNQISTIGKTCQIGNDFFSFMGNSQLSKKYIHQDSVVIIPDCPVILFTKLNNAFYYKRINGNELEYFSDSSIAFKVLLGKTIQ